MSILDKLWGRNRLQIVEADDASEVEMDRWYRLRQWSNEDFLRFKTEWGKDWIVWTGGGDHNNAISVAGVTHANAERTFLKIGTYSDFTIYLKREPRNRYDKNAIKVMASATIGWRKHSFQLGYVPAEFAATIANERDLDARPYSVHLPTKGREFGIQIRVLVRARK